MSSAPTHPSKNNITHATTRRYHGIPRAGAPRPILAAHICAHPHALSSHTRCRASPTRRSVFLSRVMDKLSGTRERRILMLGLDAAGKTTVLYKLKLNEAVTTIPTIGFNVENLRYKNLDLTVWDVGGQDKIRALWRHYFTGTDALLFVVDAADVARVDIARDELHRLLHEDELRDAALVIFANKQDLPGAMSAAQLSDKLKLSSLHHRQWWVQACCATTGEGLYDGLDWLAREGFAARR